MSILLLGRSGYIAQAFIREMDRRGILHHDLARSVVDYTDFRTLTDVISSLHPELVINCAAYVATPSVDFCEQAKSKTLMANLVFPQTLVNACEMKHVPLLHVSTGCLYNGDASYAFKESDVPTLRFDTKCGIYVGSKELAEHVVNKYPDSYIARIRLPFDEFDHPRNYITKLMTYPKVLDCLNSISHRGDFVSACLDVWNLRAPWGTYNVTNGGATWAHEICECLRNYALKESFEYWDAKEFMDTVAATPKSNACLDNSKLLATGVKMRSVAEAVLHSVVNWKTYPYQNV